MIPDTIGKTSRAGEVQRMARSVQELEHAYNLVGGDDKRLPYMPFQPADFVAILFECMAETDGVDFLDVGCGPGTKLALARELFGLDAYGIDIDQDMVTFARSNGEHAYRTDALECPDYDSYDIIWMYRPFRDRELQDRLEKKIFAEMKPGAILAGGAWENHPPNDWEIVIDDWEIRRGAWQKR